MDKKIMNYRIFCCTIQEKKSFLGIEKILREKILKRMMPTILQHACLCHLRALKNNTS